MRLKRCIVLIGLPFAGVTTATQLIAPVLRLRHIRVQQLLKAVDLDQVLSKHPLLDYALLGTNPGRTGAVIELVKDQLEKARYSDGVVLDGCPSTVHEAILLDDYLKLQNDAFLQVLYMKLLPEDEPSLIVRAKQKLVCVKCGWIYGKHFDVSPFVGLFCDRCHEKLLQPGEGDTAALARARVGWSKNRMGSILDYYRQQKCLVEWDISAAHSPLWIAYELAKYFAPYALQVDGIRSPMAEPMQMLPEQLELQLELQ
jgi:adenylate kinase family enzyme